MMMMQVKTIPMDVYVVSAPGAVAVTATVNGVEMTLARTPEGGGQAAFQAVGECVEVSDASAVVLPFVDAPVPLGMDGGVDAVQVAEMIASSEGNVNVLYDSVTQSPAEGNLDNYDAYGWAMVVTEPGRLDTVTLQPRSAGTVQDPFPVYLNIWVQDGNAWKLLGSSENGVEQALGEASVWTFSGVELVAGQKLHVDAHRQKGSEARDARLSVRVVANSLADTGMIDRDGAVRVVDWVPQYTLALSRPVGLVARGVPLAEDADLTAHAQDAVRHITAAERASWNAKAEASALAGKVNTGTFTAHANDAVKHVTAAERTKWNGKAEASALAGKVDTATFNAHANDAVKHVTAAERASWNAKADASALTSKVDTATFNAHTGNAAAHLSASERAGFAALLAKADGLLPVIDAKVVHGVDIVTGIISIPMGQKVTISHLPEPTPATSPYIIHTKCIAAGSIAASANGYMIEITPLQAGPGALYLEALYWDDDDYAGGVLSRFCSHVRWMVTE